MANRSGHVGLATFPRLRTRPIFVAMAKNPDKPKKDPARPTRAKAARPDVLYRIVDEASKPFTFRVLGLTESGRVEILERGYMRRYIDLDMLAQCLKHGAIAEVQ